jgi:hypothetical protein
MKIEPELQLSFNYEMECLHARNGMGLDGSRGCSVINVDGFQDAYRVSDELKIIEVYGDHSTLGDLKEIFRGNLCKNNMNITPNISYSTCKVFIEASATHGLKVLILYYLQLLRQLVHNHNDPYTIIKQRELMDLCILQKEFISPFMKVAIEIILESRENKYNKLNEIQMYMLILLIGVIVIAHLMVRGIFGQFMINNVSV